MTTPASICRPDVFQGQPFLLKSVHYAALNRADLFTLPCPPEVVPSLNQHKKLAAGAFGGSSCACLGDFWLCTVLKFSVCVFCEQLPVSHPTKVHTIISGAWTLDHFLGGRCLTTTLWTWTFQSSGRGYCSSSCGAPSLHLTASCTTGGQ